MKDFGETSNGKRLENSSCQAKICLNTQLNIFIGCVWPWMYILKYLLWLVIIVYCDIYIYILCMTVYCEIFTVVVYECIRWNTYCSSVWRYNVKYVLWLCMTVYCEKFTVVVYDCILWNIYCGCVWLYNVKYLL